MFKNISFVEPDKLVRFCEEIGKVMFL